MNLRLNKCRRRRPLEAFTLIEVMISSVVVVMVMSGAIYSYVTANRMAEWSAMSQSVQSYAVQGIERARSAQWNSQLWPITNGVGTGDELYPSTNAVFSEVDTNFIPSTRGIIFCTNYIYVTSCSTNPFQLRQIRSDVVWTFPLTKRVYTNTVITLRAPDQ